MRNHDEPSAVEQAVLLAAILAAVYGFAVLVLSLEHKNAPQAPAVTGNGSPPPSSLSQPAALLSHPIPYSATVRQSGDGITEPRIRYYVSTSTKEAK
jgi:hypothetical protein